MSLRNDSQSAASALVFTQYSLCSYASELCLIQRGLRSLASQAKFPSALLDLNIRRVSTLLDEVRDEIASIDDLLDPRTATAPAFPPDGPTLFDRHGNANESDPTDVLLGDKAVSYVPGAPTPRPGTKGDADVIHAVASPQKRRKGR